MTTLGERLRDLIYEKGLDQKKFAEQFKLPVSTLNGYVTDYRTPDINLQKKIADFFGVSLDYLLGRTDERYIKGDDFVKENLTLIRDNMTYEQLSQDIGKKLKDTLHSKVFTPEYLEGLASGKIIPPPQRVATLAHYAEIDVKFFSKVNTIHDFIRAREEHKHSVENKKRDQITNEAVGMFAVDPDNRQFIEFAKELKDKNVDIDELKEFILSTNDISRHLSFIKKIIKRGIDPDDIESFNLKVKL